MESLNKNFKELLSLTPLEFKRYLYSEVAWEDRMIGIVGPRGIRETFFFNQMRVKNKVYRSEKGDFNISNITFEVGGKSKTQQQIKDLNNAYIVKDNIEYGFQNVIPLWAFGLNY